MNRTKKAGYWTMMTFTLLMALGAVLTALPAASAYRENILGYRSFCTFTPFSTLGCVLVAVRSFISTRKNFTDSSAEKNKHK